MEISKMAQNTQDGNVGSTTEDAGLQLQIPGLEQFKNLKFVQSEANPADLIIQFPDGSETVIPNYIPLAQAGAPPALTLEDGTVIPGAEIVGLIDNLDYDKIATAAGDAPGAGGQTTTGGGAGFLADPSGPLGDDIGHGPYAGGIALADQVGFEQLPADNGPDGDGGLPFEAIDDHVIHNIQGGIGEQRDPWSNPIDIPDEALRHNDIYPRGSWDLTSVDNPGPNSPKEATFGQPNVPDVSNSDPDGNDLGITTFKGPNSTARFEHDYLPGQSYDNFGDSIAALNTIGLANEDGKRTDLFPRIVTSDAPYNAPERVHRTEWDEGATVLQTEAPGAADSGSNADWDGASIYLYVGEIVELSYQSNTNGKDATDYILAIDDPNESGGGDPLNTGTGLNWDVTNYDAGFGGISNGNTISYEVKTEGWHYVGTGFNDDSGAADTDYFTLIRIDGVPFGEFDYSATDEVLSDDAHVTVEARDPDNYAPSGEILYGTSGDNIIISSENGDDLRGFGGLDVLIGRGGDDDLRGGGASDLFLFENASIDGHDTIFDFDPTGDGDIINLDILFDNLGIADGRAAREPLILATPTDADGGAGTTDTLLTITDGGATDFSIIILNNDFSGIGEIASLIDNGNLVVDES